MTESDELAQANRIMTQIIGPPFEWRPVDGGMVRLEDATSYGGTQGGEWRVAGFWMARYPVTNAQYQAFIDDPDGYSNPQWWDFSPQAQQWRNNTPHARATAFPGALLPRTRVSWFENMAFCAWLSVKWSQVAPGLTRSIRLPTEQEWQRAAAGDSGWVYPWGDEIQSSLGNYGNHCGQTTAVDRYPEGQSVYGVMDLIGNVWERCLSAWGKDVEDLSGYTYRVMRGGAWNVSRTEYMCSASRYGHPPRGRLNDAGFRVACVER